MSDMLINKNKKSQITLFVIIAVIFLIIILLVLTNKKSTEEKNVNVNSLINEIEQGTIRNHIIDCMTLITEEGLRKVASSGGNIYSFEGGSISYSEEKIGFDYLKYEANGRTFFVVYGLETNEVCNYSDNSYLYPDNFLSEFNVEYNKICEFKSFYSAYDGFFGMVALPKLCHTLRDSGCEAFAKAQPDKAGFSIQMQLERYIESNLPNCVNFSAFTERMPVTITIDKPPEAELTIQESNLDLVVKYPLKIVFKDEEPIITVFDYKSHFDIRFGLMYNFIFNILSKESRDINFNISKDYITSPFWRDGIDLKKIKDVCIDCEFPFVFDDIIEVTDRKSLINGKQLVFRSALRNRRPVIDFVEDKEYEVDYGGGWVDIPLTAIDPDDGPVNLFFFSTTIGGNHNRRFYDSAADESYPGWHEDDTSIQSTLNELKRIKFKITRADSSRDPHKVGVVAVDDSGLFDVKNFSISVKDIISNSPLDSECVFDCVDAVCSKASSNSLDAMYRFSNCASCAANNLPHTCVPESILLSQPSVNFCEKDWCDISANQCRVLCSAGKWFSSMQNSETHQQCYDCVYSIIFSGQIQKHKKCTAGTAGNQGIPDCFKVKVYESGVWKEKFFNDFEFQGSDSITDDVVQPGYIVE